VIGEPDPRKQRPMTSRPSPLTTFPLRCSREFSTVRPPRARKWP